MASINKGKSTPAPLYIIEWAWNKKPLRYPSLHVLLLEPPDESLLNSLLTQARPTRSVRRPRELGFHSFVSRRYVPRPVLPRSPISVQSVTLRKRTSVLLLLRMLATLKAPNDLHRGQGVNEEGSSLPCDKEET